MTPPPPPRDEDDTALPPVPPTPAAPRGPTSGPLSAAGAGALVVAGLLVAAWLVLFDVLGTYTYGHGGKSFAVLLVAAGLVVGFPRIWRALGRVPRVGRPELLAILVVLGLGMKPARAFLEELKGNDRWAFDIGENTYLAGTAFLAGKNPYAERAQAGYIIQPGPKTTVEGGRVKMFGLDYAYGYPYFPAMFLSYLPFRPLAPFYHSLRIANGVFFALTLVGIFWLSHRLLPVDCRAVGRWLAVAAFVGTPALPQEIWKFVVTDILIALFALYAFIALSHRRPALAGVLFGLCQASKLLPGPVLVAPVLLWLFRRPGFWPVLVGYAATTVALVGPALLAEPELFFSSTILFYLTNHAEGDSSSLWFDLPRALRGPFSLAGYALTGAVVALGARRRDRDLSWPLALGFAAYLVFTAFNKMIHLNYVWGVYALGCVAVVARVGGSAVARPSAPAA